MQMDKITGFNIFREFLISFIWNYKLCHFLQGLVYSDNALII